MVFFYGFDDLLLFTRSFVLAELFYFFLLSTLFLTQSRALVKTSLLLLGIVGFYAIFFYIAYSQLINENLSLKLTFYVLSMLLHGAIFNSLFRDCRLQTIKAAKWALNKLV